MNKPITEQGLIEALVQGMSRSPLQRNRIHAADAEIIVMPFREESALAATTDTIAEEIVSGLYADSVLAGWMTVMASMSDLAAVGAEPLGMLIAQTLPRTMTERDVASLYAGIRSALAACSTYLLGGDTNIADRLILTGTALGIVSNVQPLNRVGCRPGDLLYASGPLGSGNAYAAALFNGTHAAQFRPVARLREGKALRGIASSCMDTSDGVVTTLDQLLQLNGVGFRVHERWEEALARDAQTTMEALSLPAWFLLAGCHGEFELLFTVPPEREPQLHIAAAEIDWHPWHIGEVTSDCLVTIVIDGAAVPLDTGRIRGLWEETGGDVRTYLDRLMAIDESMRINKHSERLK